MPMRGGFLHWWAGWVELALHDAVAGYAALGPLQRLRAELAVAGAALRSGGFWRVTLWCAALALAAQILAWQHDLRGWRRDGLRSLPVAIAAPWVAAGRRRRLEQRLAEPLNCVTDRAPEAPHSRPGNVRERRRWRNPLRPLHRPPAGHAPAGWISCWRSRFSARWPPWRSPASRT
jgi:hypothetical protein